jgi:TIR domain
MPKLQLFLSYVSVESRLADLLQKHLIADFIGLLDVFFSSDKLSIPAGAKWLSDLAAALNRAQLHLVLCSRDSISRTWINFEVGATFVRGVTVIPVCHSGLLPAQLPVPLSENEAIIASEEDGLRSLYRVIANALGSDVPDIDFEGLRREIAGIEKDFVKERSMLISPDSIKDTTEIVPDPKALCISSQQFLKLGFENQLQKVIDAFPSSVRHQRVISSSELREAIQQEKFDIVHIAAYVCSRSGAVYFSEVDPASGTGISEDPDILDSETLARLFRFAGVKLTVIGSCDSMALAVTLTTVCHVVAAKDMVSATMMAAWVEAFYRALPKSSLSQALSDADDLSRAPMRFYGRQVAPANVFFKPTLVGAKATA